MSLLPAFPAERTSALAHNVVRPNVVLHLDAVVAPFLRTPPHFLVVVSVGFVVELVVVLNHWGQSRSLQVPGEL